MILVLDNHDSFTFNLVQGLGALGAEVRVCASDAISLRDVRGLAPEAVLISPGPGRPCDAGISLALVRALGPNLPVLGVCLGHQVVCAALGARIIHAPRVVHGRTSAIHHDGSDLFLGIESPFVAARYHSLVADAASLPPELVASAFAETGELMAVRHRAWPLLGVQFHPESFMSVGGVRLLENFLRYARSWRQHASHAREGAARG